MSVKVRKFRNGGWEVDINVLLPSGERFRERRKSPTSSKSGAVRWGEERERQLLLSGPPKEKKEVPTLKEFAPRFLECHALANRQKPSGIASKETILRVHLVPALGDKKLDAIRTEDVQQLKSALQDKAREDREQRVDGAQHAAEEGGRVGGHRADAVHDQAPVDRQSRRVVS